MEALEAAPRSWQFRNHQKGGHMPESAGGKWDFWIDRGGTFTDVAARDPRGDIQTTKLLSQNPGAYRDAAIAGIRSLLEVPADQPIPQGAIATV